MCICALPILAKGLCHLFAMWSDQYAPAVTGSGMGDSSCHQLVDLSHDCLVVWMGTEWMHAILGQLHRIQCILPTSLSLNQTDSSGMAEERHLEWSSPWQPSSVYHASAGGQPPPSLLGE